MLLESYLYLSKVIASRKESSLYYYSKFILEKLFVRIYFWTTENLLDGPYSMGRILIYELDNIYYSYTGYYIYSEYSYYYIWSLSSWS